MPEQNEGMSRREFLGYFTGAAGITGFGWYQALSKLQKKESHLSVETELEISLGSDKEFGDLHQTFHLLEHVTPEFNKNILLLYNYIDRILEIEQGLPDSAEGLLVFMKKATDNLFSIQSDLSQYREAVKSLEIFYENSKNKMPQGSQKLLEGKISDFNATITNFQTAAGRLTGAIEHARESLKPVH